MKKRIPLPFLYFLLPIIFYLLICYATKVNDVWFLLSHGRYVLSHGFPHTEFLTFHTGLHFVMQQWLFSTLLYLFYHFLGDIGVFIFTAIFNFFILYMTYKLCMLISSNNVFASCLISSITDLLLEMCFFIVPRPQIASMLLLICTLYLLEKLIRKNDHHIIFLLPLISIFLINFHASLWLMLFIFCMPYVVELFIFYFKKKDHRLFILLKAMIISFIVGIFNPYTWENMFYSLYSYGIPYFNKIIREMHCFSLKYDDTGLFIMCLLMLGIIIVELICLIFERKKYSISYYFLYLGCSILAFLNVRNISLLIIGTLPFVVNGVSYKMKGSISSIIVIPMSIIITALFTFQNHNHYYHLEDYNLKPIVAKLNKIKKEDIKLYTAFNDGSYLEYYSYKPYIDSRAEVFIKKLNHKEDIFMEFYKIWDGSIDFSKFLEKYQFTHLIVSKDSNIYHYLKRQANYKIIYQNKERILYEKISE